MKRSAPEEVAVPEQVAKRHYADPYVGPDADPKPVPALFYSEFFEDDDLRHAARCFAPIRRNFPKTLALLFELEQTNGSEDPLWCRTMSGEHAKTILSRDLDPEERKRFVEAVILGDEQHYGGRKHGLVGMSHITIGDFVEILFEVGASMPDEYYLDDALCVPVVRLHLVLS